MGGLLMFAKYDSIDGRYAFSVSDNGGIFISDTEYTALLDAQGRGLIIIDRDGAPVAVENISAPPVTHEQQIAQAEYERGVLRARSDSEIAWRQDAVDAVIATEEEVVALAEWKKYRVLLMRVDISTAPDIVWPPVPT
ncbi:TPA: tail fiber assembly protein [Enterobacter cloacae]|nr:tail fiber assembly protein [Enterobacter cloacae]